MEFNVLGPLEAYEHGQPVPLGGRRQRAVLADLLVRANEVVSSDRLIDEVWSGDPPEAALNALQSYVSRLRRTLADSARIERHPPGYVLRVDPERIDAVRFERLVREGHATLADDPEAALARFAEALELWRGPPLADLDDMLALRPEIGRLEELRLAAVEGRIAAELALGRHKDLVAELETLVEEQRLRERLWGHLMLALYRAGRQADALDAYQRARRFLADELGLEPSPELRELQGRILRQDPSLEPAARRLRGYRLLEEIGAGSFGVVHRAIQPHVGRDVAVKVIGPALADNPRFVRRFEAEAQLVARLEHPRIVPLYDYWREPGGAYLVMRWLRGGSLKQTLEDRPLEPERALALVEQVASGLAVAHRQGVVHRDVKPANILLDEDGNAYLSDFGIAVDVAAKVTSPTPDSITYVSPEQTRGEPSTSRTDVYSLGVVLREALAGQVLSAAVEAVIERATAESPDDRYGDAEALAAALREVLGDEALPVVAPNPYKGLRPFGEADAADFFGRETLVERLVARLREGARFLALVGASGSGKSSALRAGLLSALRQGAVPGSSEWLVAEMSPGSQPFGSLGAALRGVAVEEQGTNLLLVVDQLEEVFTLVADTQERDRFLTALATTATDPRMGVRVIVALRADFYDRPLEHPELGPLIRSGVETLLPLSPEELERAVAGPAAKVGAACEPGLVGEIVAEAAGRAGALPLFQYALRALFDRRHDRTLTLAGYRELGGLGGAVARKAEELYEAAGEEGRAAARQLFLRLVALGEGSEPTRRRASRAELASLEVDQGALEQVVEAFGRHRLLSFDRDAQTRAPTVELAHEALLDAWGRLRGWIAEAREDGRMRARLAAAAAEWRASGRGASFLLRGTRLDLFAGWLPGAMVALARSEREYLEASLSRRDAEQAEDAARQAREQAVERRSVRRLRTLVIVLALGALVATGLSLFAFAQQREARREAHTATARELAAAALTNLDGDPERSVLLALEAVAESRAAGSVLREAEEALHAAVQADRVVLSVPGSGSAVSFSPDGRRLASIREDGMAAVWDAASGRQLGTLGRGTVASVVFGPDGRLTTVSEAGTVKLWDAMGDKELATLGGIGPDVGDLSYSRSGSFLAVSSLDGPTKVWDTATGRRVATLPTGADSLAFSPDGLRLATADSAAARIVDVDSGRVLVKLDIPAFDVAFSPDGSRLAAVGLNGFIGVWNATTGARVLTFPAQPGHLNSVRFNRDGRRLAIGGDDGIVRIWDAETGRALLALPGQGSAVESVAFSPDGARAAACCGGDRAMVWDVTPAGGRELLTLAAHDQMILNVGFSPDGSRLATASLDGTAKVWDAASGRQLLDLTRHAGPVTDIVFTPDGRRLATASFDLTARLWDARTGEQLRVLRGHTGPVWGTSFVPDGSRLATAAEDGTARIWNTRSGRELQVLRGHEDPVWDATFSPDGKRLATVSNDFTARIWDADTGRQLQVLRGHRANVVELAFNPDGSRLATAGEDAARVWDIATGRQLFALSGHAGAVLDIDFSPDGGHLATASLDGTAKLWDAATGEELLSLAVPGGQAGRLAFSPNGRVLAVADAAVVRLYVLSVDDLVELARGRVTRRLTGEECRQYLHRDRCQS